MTKEQLEFEEKWGKICKKCQKRHLFLGLGGSVDGNKYGKGCDVS